MYKRQLHNRKYVSIPKEDDPLTITLDRAIELIKEKMCIRDRKEVNPETVGDASATGYFFAQVINKTLDVPVGLVMANKGGSRRCV